jgi:hypothetical protein
MSLKIETAYSLNAETIIGEGLPTVYVDRVIVDDYIKDPAQNQAQLSTRLNLIIKDSSDGKYSSWYNNPFSSILKPRIKICIAQVTKKETIDAWSKVQSPPQANGIFQNQDSKLLDGTSFQYYTLNDLMGEQTFDSLNEKYSEDGSQLGTIYSFNKVVNFPSRQASPGNNEADILTQEQKNLSYFVFTFLTPEEDQYEILSISSITRQDVKSSGKLSTQASVFLTDEQESSIWTGPVHYHNGDVRINGEPFYGYMGGSIHGQTGNQPILKRINVENNAVQDFSSLSSLSTNVANTEPIALKPLFDTEINKNSLFSNMNLSRDSEGNCNFVFSINFKNLIKQKGLDGDVLTGNDEVDILDYISVDSLKVFRRRVYGSPLSGQKTNNTSTSTKFRPPAPPPSFNKYRMDKIGDVEQIQVKTGADYIKKFSKKYSVDRTRELILEAYEENGSFKISESTGDGVSTLKRVGDIFNQESEINDILTFTGTDNSVRKASNGFYQYEVQLNVRDDRKKYFEDATSVLSGHIETLEKIISIHSISPEYYDNLIDKFTVRFINDLSINGQQLIDVSGDFWEEIPRDFLKIYNVISKNQLSTSSKKEIFLTMKNILSPISGNSKGYLRIQKILEELLSAVQNNVLATFAKKSNKGTEVTTLKSKSNGNSYIAFRKNIITSIRFQEYFNASLQPNFGNLFFDVSDEELVNDNAGVRFISYDNFDTYKNIETTKYYTSPNASVSISKFPEATAPADRMAYSYFTPSVVFDKHSQPQKYNEFLSNENKSLSTIIDNLTKDKPENIAPSIESSKTKEVSVVEEERLNSKLSNYFSLNFEASVITEEDASQVTDYKSEKSAKKATTNDFGGVLKKDKAAIKAAVKQEKLGSSVFKKIFSRNIIQKNRDANVKVGNFRPDVLANTNGINSAVISQLPNQIKALITSQDQRNVADVTPVSSVKSDMLEFINEDPFSNQETFMRAKYMFETIVKIEYLSGYEKTPGTSQHSPRSPIWKTLNSVVFDDAKKQNKKLYCKIVPYSSDTFNIQYDEEQSLPILEKYFFIGTDVSSTGVKSTTIQNEPTKGLSMTLNNPQYQVSYEILNVSENVNESILTQSERVENRSLTSRLRNSTIRNQTTRGTTGGTTY